MPLSDHSSNRLTTQLTTQKATAIPLEARDKTVEKQPAIRKHLYTINYSKIIARIVQNFDISRTLTL